MVGPSVLTSGCLQALNFTSTWKTPCILMYAKPEVANCNALQPMSELRNVLTGSAARSISNGARITGI